MKKTAPGLKSFCAALALVLLAALPAAAGWTVDTTVSNTKQLRAVWGYSASKILAVGDQGTMLLYDGTQWNNVPAVTSKNIFGVWWASDHEAYASCDTGVLLHLNGTDWEPVTIGTTKRLREVWGASATDIFTVGEDGTILHYDGSAWKAMPSPTPLTLQSVWGTSGSDVYAVGGASGTGNTGNGVIIHYDGKQWSTQSYGSIPRLQDVFGFKNRIIFAVGEGGIVYSLAAGSKSWQTAVEQGSLTDAAITLRDVWGSSPSNVYAVGDGGAVLHYDGSAWSSQVTGLDKDLFGIWGASAGDIWAVRRDGSILKYEDSNPDNATCPFAASVANAGDLRLLRSARDTRLGTLSGMILTALFYATEPETAGIARRDPALRARVAAIVAQNRPVLQALADGRPGRMSQASVSEIVQCLRTFQEAGSRRLSVVLGALCRGLEQGWLPRLLDVTVE